MEHLTGKKETRPGAVEDQLGAAVEAILKA
jgi:hypothetical protein